MNQKSIYNLYNIQAVELHKYFQKTFEYISSKTTKSKFFKEDIQLIVKNYIWDLRNPHSYSFHFQHILGKGIQAYNSKKTP